MSITPVYEKRLKTSLIIGCILIYILEGVAINPIAFWNMVPLYISYHILRNGLNSPKKSVRSSGIAFTVGALACVLYIHFAWFFDLLGTKTGSSTAGVIIIFVPFYAVGSGIILCIPTYIVGWNIERRNF